MRTLVVFILFVGLSFAAAVAQHQPVNIPPMTQSAPLRGLDPSKAITDYLHLVWQTEQGLPQNSAQALCQTRNGYLWIGTAEGLVRFDGVRFVAFDKRNTPAIKNNDIKALVEDRDGSLWIGTRGGGVNRLRYDDKGNAVFTTYTTKNGLSNDLVWSLLQDSDGAMWIGTEGGLNRLRLDTAMSTMTGGNASFTTYTTKNGLSHDFIMSLLQDREGNIWIGTRGGGVNRLRYDNHADAVFTTYTTKNGLLSNFVWSLLQDSGGAIWIGTEEGLNRLRVDTAMGTMAGGNAAFTAYTTKNGLSNNFILSLLQDRGSANREGVLWIGTRGGVNRLLYDNRGGNQVNDVFTSYTSKNGLTNNFVRSLFQDGDGALWIGTQGGGVNRLQNVKFTGYSANNGLSNDFVRALFQDRSHDSLGGTLWVGTWGGGLNRLRHDPAMGSVAGGNATFTSYTTKNGLSNDLILSLSHDHNHNTHDTHHAHNGVLWVGTWGGGLNRLRYDNHGKAKFTAYTTKNGLSNDIVWSLLQDRSYDNRGKLLWIGTYGGGLNCLRYDERGHTTFTSYTTKNGLSNDFVRTLLQDRDGSIWIGTNGGLNRLKEGVWTRYTTKDGLSNDIVVSLLQDSDGTLWVGTNGGGLNRLSNGKFTAITTQNDLFDDVAHCILDDDCGYLWMSCNKGIYRARKSDLNAFADGKLARIPCEVFGTADGMKSTECNGGGSAGWKTADGRLWFATVVGVAMVNPKNLTYNPFAPAVIIEEIKTDSVVLDLSAAVTVPANVEKFEFSYTATSLLAPEKVKFKVMLEGYDKTWTDAGTRRTAYYTNLPRGRKYRFRVIACNNDGVWNAVGATAMFSITPYFWETWWFYGLCVIVAGGATYHGTRWRVRRLKARAEVLEQLVDERTREVQEQAAEIQLANLQLQENNRELDEANRFKTQMLSIVAHDLKNPIHNIIGYATLAAYDLPPDSPPVQMMLHVEQSASRMLRLITDILETAALELGKIQIERHSISLAYLIERAAKTYQDAAAAKEQTIILELQKDVIIAADEERLLQVFDNLISNAVKYSPHGKQIWVRAKQGSGNIRIEVQDEGPGFTEEDKHKLFGFFQRLSAQPIGGESSNGVGLAIVKKIVELHGGTIEIESEPSKGATFIVVLPIT